ncbi:hypothetical protein B0H34DRAFT_676376 [Crassisporium funariophilum]|nr:hypothetical protein B0H34DRAFT_676376 [Crassisporium funariophilum]
MDALDSDQRRSLQQLREITNGADDEVAVGVLSSVDWDVQRAAELIFGTSSASQPTTSSQPNHVVHTFEVDDSHQGEAEREERHRPAPNTHSFVMARPLLSILAFPFHILSNVFRFIFGVLRIPIPQLRFMSLNFYRPLRPRPASRGGPDRWLRDLEEETGAISIGRLKLPRGTTSSFNVEAGQSSLTSRASRTNGYTEDGRKLLPDFTTGSYEEMLKTCQREAKVGCVILVSEEHDDVPEFKRSTLTDSAFVKILYDNDIIVWGGDVRDQEAWSASEKLQATTYPFVAFLALQPRRNPSSSSRTATTSSPPSLTILSRHQGKSTPSSGPTSAQTLVDHLQSQLLPRVTPFLNRITAAQREREYDRHLREEQDRAFKETARRDKERIETKMAEERADRERKRQAEEESRLEGLRKAKDAEVARQRESNRMDWRRWTRRAVVVNLLPTNGNAQGTLRIAIRLPSGGRVIHQFSPSATLTSLYAFVDSQFVPPQFPTSDDPASLPDQVGTGEQALETHVSKSSHPADYWGFQVVLAYPRMEIPWKRGVKLSDIDQLKGGGQVVAELVGGGRRSPAERVRETTDEDDGYSTEDSE